MGNTVVQIALIANILSPTLMGCLTDVKHPPVLIL